MVVGEGILTSVKRTVVKYPTYFQVRRLILAGRVTGEGSKDCRFDNILTDQLTKMMNLIVSE